MPVDNTEFVSSLYFGYQDLGVIQYGLIYDLILGNEVLAPSSYFCSYHCAEINVFGFDYTLEDTSIAAVPVPATLPLALSAVGLMGWVGRRRKKA